MKAAILGLLAETSIHPGAGSSVGVIDLPVAREAATDYPVIVGSSLKGALSQTTPESERDRAFGDENRAGAILVSDARLLLLPVRSLTGAYRWVTCPLALERYARDMRRAGREPDLPELGPETDEAVVSAGDGGLFLEELQFQAKADAEKIEKLAEALKPLVRHDSVQARLARQFAVLHDEAFGWFARYGLAVQARNKLDDDKKSKNLWYEETLPPDTLMYALLLERSQTGLGLLSRLFPADNRYLQVGGNETVGQGWFAVSVVRTEAAVEG